MDLFNRMAIQQEGTSALQFSTLLPTKSALAVFASYLRDRGEDGPSQKATSKLLTRYLGIRLSYSSLIPLNTGFTGIDSDEPLVER